MPTLAFQRRDHLSEAEPDGEGEGDDDEQDGGNLHEHGQTFLSGAHLLCFEFVLGVVHHWHNQGSGPLSGILPGRLKVCHFVELPNQLQSQNDFVVSIS